MSTVDNTNVYFRGRSTSWVANDNLMNDTRKAVYFDCLWINVFALTVFCQLT